MPTLEELKHLQSQPLERKVRLTQTRIIEWYEHYGGKVYVSFSGGKYSTVLLDLARRVYPDIEAVFVNTGLEYPEIVEFVKTFDNVTIVRPNMSFREVIEKYGYPVIGKEVAKCVYYSKSGSEWADRKLNGQYGQFSERFMKYKYLTDAPFAISHRCCDVMKKTPLHNYESKSKKKPIIGTTADESNQRKQGWLKTGCNSFDDRRPLSKPMSFWKEQDVLQYIRKFNIPIASVYGDVVPIAEFDGQESIDGLDVKLKTTGLDRSGCVFCAFGAHLEKGENRFQRMKRTHPKLYNYCMKPWEDGGLGLSKVLDFIGVKYE